MVNFLCPISDYPFTKEDFISSFEHLQKQYTVSWFEDVRLLSLCKYNMLEYLFEDTEAVGISMSEKEFYIGTMGGYWAVFSNYPKYDAFYFRDSQGMYEQDILDFLLTKLSLPLDLAQDCLSIMRKYDKLY